MGCRFAGRRKIKAFPATRFLFATCELPAFHSSLSTKKCTVFHKRRKLPGLRVARVVVESAKAEAA